MTDRVIFIPNITEVYDLKTGPYNLKIVDVLRQKVLDGYKVWVSASDEWATIYSQDEFKALPAELVTTFSTLESKKDMKSMNFNPATSITISDDAKNDDKCGTRQTLLQFFGPRNMGVTFGDITRLGSQIILYYGNLSPSDTKTIQESKFNVVACSDLNAEREYKLPSGRYFVVHMNQALTYRQTLDLMVLYFKSLSFLILTNGTHPRELENKTHIFQWQF